MKKIWVISAIVLTIFLTAYFPGIMISPGHVNKVHANIEQSCFSCHKAFFGISNEKCIKCHQLDKIGLDSSSNKNEKAILFHNSLKKQSCTSCHTDHTGAAGKLTMSTFNHDLVATNILANCGSCHLAPKDEMHLDLAINSCGNCHTTKKWKPSTFNHDKYFLFDENHTNDCSSCHTKNNYTQYSCTNCHEHNLQKMISEHKEEGIININDCASCHRSANENDIRQRTTNAESRNGDTEEMKRYINAQKEEED